MKAHDLELASNGGLRAKRINQERERESGCTFPSCCTTLASFQVLNCYFNMTTSHVLHHLHRTPSTHPARLSVGPRRRALLRHLRNMCAVSFAKNNLLWKCRAVDCDLGCWNRVSQIAIPSGLTVSHPTDNKLQQSFAKYLF